MANLGYLEYGLKDGDLVKLGLQSYFSDKAFKYLSRCYFYFARFNNNELLHLHLVAAFRLTKREHVKAEL